MSKLEDYDEIDTMQLLDNILATVEDTTSQMSPENKQAPQDGSPLNNSFEAFDESTSIKLKQDPESEFETTNVEDCMAMLDLNKDIIHHLLELKKQITQMLQKCQSKLELLEADLRGDSSQGAKILTCNAGMPYFKDRDLFSAPNNEDETLKEMRGELQIESLPKIYSWTAKDRNKLLKAVRQEVILSLLDRERSEDTESEEELSETKDRRNEKNDENKLVLSKDFRDFVGPLGEREFDWFKIATAHFSTKHSAIECRVMWNVYLHPDINKKSWNKSEDNRLKEIARKHAYQDWDEIARVLGTRRTAYQCFVRYNTTRKMPKVRNCVWAEEEDEKLLKLVYTLKIGDFVPWSEVASWMRNRTKQQAYFRFTYSLSPDLVKGRFSKKEENELKDAVTRYGKNFPKISSELMRNRSTIQLNDHYQRLSTNAVERANIWTSNEDEKLLKLYERFGPNWSKIAKNFSRKSRTQVRHRHTALTKYINRGIPVLEICKIQKKRQITGEQKDEEGLEGEENLDDIDNEKEGKEDEEDNEGESSDEETADETESEDQEDTIQDDDSENEDNIKCIKGVQFREKDFQDDVDKELIEYFRTLRTIERISPKKETYVPQDLEATTRQLYEVLQILNANFNIPDDLSCLGARNCERYGQLLRSLKLYTQTKNDKTNREKAVEICASHMFSASSNDVESVPFVPPLPFDSHIKWKKLKNSQSIDCQLNTTRNFLLETSNDLETPDFVQKYIGGEEMDLKFEKISRLLRTSGPKRIKSNVVKKLFILPPNMLLSDNNLPARTSPIKIPQYIANSSCNNVGSSNAGTDSTNKTVTLSSENLSMYTRRENGEFDVRDTSSKKSCEVVSRSNIYTNFMLEESQHYQFSIPYTETIAEEEMTPAIDVSHATLLGLKNLMYLKRLHSKTDASTCSKTPSSIEKKEFRDAQDLLEMRLECLLQYPLGLSRTVLPKVYGTDSLFAYDQMRKRKSNVNGMQGTKRIKFNKSNNDP